MDWLTEHAFQIIGGISATLSLAAGALVWSAHKEFISHRELADHETADRTEHGRVHARIDAIVAENAELRRDQAVLRTQLEHGPTAAEVATLREEMARLAGTIGALESQLNGVAAIVSRIEVSLGLLIQHHIKES